MSSNGFKEIVSFFKTARHLWGRCPNCDCVFRLSDAAISSSPNPPRDWLARLKRQEASLALREQDLIVRDNELLTREENLREGEWDLKRGQRNLERDAKIRVREILGSETEIKKLIRIERKAAVKSSRSTLIGRLMERMAPCLQRFGYSPLDMRTICDPMDYVVFDGLTVERRVKRITFVEVKCGRSVLSSAQRSIVEAIDKGRVETEVWEIGEHGIPIAQQFSRPGRFALPSAED